MVTPFEMEVACVRYISLIHTCTICVPIIILHACRSREWSGDYVTDYQDLFPGIYALGIVMSSFINSYNIYSICSALSIWSDWRMKLELKTCDYLPTPVTSTPSHAGGTFHVPVEEDIKTEVCTSCSIICTHEVL